MWIAGGVCGWLFVKILLGLLKSDVLNIVLFKASRNVLLMEKIESGSGGMQTDPVSENQTDDPPDLKCKNRKYTNPNSILTEGEDLLLKRLNTVWKRIYVSLKQFHVTAITGEILHSDNGEEYDYESEYTFTINLTCSLFTADLQLVYKSEIRGSKGDDGGDYLSYTIENMKIIRGSTKLQPLELKSYKNVFETSTRHMMTHNHEAMFMDCMFVPYGVLSSMQDYLIYNKVLVAVVKLRNLMNPSTSVSIPDEAKGIIFQNYRKLCTESARELFRSLLLECRPQWGLPHRIEFIRRNTLSNPDLIHPADE